MPSIGICFSWLSGSSRRGGKDYRGQIRLVFNHILIMDLVDVENGFRGVISPDLEAEIVPVVSCLP